MSRFDDDASEPVDRDWYPEWIARWMREQFDVHGVKPGIGARVMCASDTYGVRPLSNNASWRMPGGTVRRVSDIREIDLDQYGGLYIMGIVSADQEWRTTLHPLQYVFDEHDMDKQWFEQQRTQVDVNGGGKVPVTGEPMSPVIRRYEVDPGRFTDAPTFEQFIHNVQVKPLQEIVGCATLHLTEQQLIRVYAALHQGDWSGVIPEHEYDMTAREGLLARQRMSDEETWDMDANTAVRGGATVD